MRNDLLAVKCKEYLKILCVEIGERCVGSEGNRQATTFLADELSSRRWRTELAEFDAIDWAGNGAVLISEGKHFEVLVSPYSNGFRGEGVLIPVSTFNELSKT